MEYDAAQSRKKKKKDACEAHVATWKSIFCGGKKIPLMSLKYLHCKGGGRHMWRSLVTMVIFWAFWPGSSSSYRAQDVGVGHWFQIPGEGLAGKPTCRAHKPNICCTKVWKSLAHKYVPCWGWSQAELPAAVSFHQRQSSVGGVLQGRGWVGGTRQG